MILDTLFLWIFSEYFIVDVFFSYRVNYISSSWFIRYIYLVKGHFLNFNRSPYLLSIEFKCNKPLQNQIRHAWVNTVLHWPILQPIWLSIQTDDWTNMISVDQWRTVIGCFSPRRNKQKWKPSTIIISNTHYFRIGVRSVIFISLCIILSGDVETNPGPNHGQILDELKAIRQDNNQHFKELRKDIPCLEAEIYTMKDKVNQAITDSTMSDFVKYSP